MTDAEWSQSFARSLGVYLAGEGLTERDERGHPLRDSSFLVLFNAHHEAIDFQLPSYVDGARWSVVMDTSREFGLVSGETCEPGKPYRLEARALALLEQQTPESD
jgi:glycogen operon protein